MESPNLKSDQGPITTTPSENAIGAIEVTMDEKLQRGLWNYFRLAWPGGRPTGNPSYMAFRGGVNPLFRHVHDDIV